MRQLPSIVFHPFRSKISSDADGVFFVKPVFEFLASNSAKTYSNSIVTTLLELDLLKNPDMLGSPIALMVFRTIIAGAPA